MSGKERKKKAKSMHYGLYDRFLENYKMALMVSIFLLVLAAGIILHHRSVYGSYFNKGIDFTGGMGADVVVTSDFDIQHVKQVAEQMMGTEVRVKKGKSGNSYLLVLETQKEMTKDDVKKIMNAAGIEYKDVSVRYVSAEISKAFWREAMKAFLIAFAGMAIVVFLTFRTVVPSMAIILAATSDIVFAIALMDLFGVKMTLATLSALLILIGYSVDTDILLSTRVLKRGVGTLNERIKSSAKTGMMMTLTSILAMIVLYVFTPAETLKQIASVIIFGLVADIPFTWLQNVSLLKAYLERGDKG